MQVRTATVADADAVLSLAGKLANSFDVEERPFRAALHDILNAEHALLLVAEDGEGVVGYCLGFEHYT